MNKIKRIIGTTALVGVLAASTLTISGIAPNQAQAITRIQTDKTYQLQTTRYGSDFYFNAPTKGYFYMQLTPICVGNCVMVDEIYAEMSRTSDNKLLEDEVIHYGSGTKSFSMFAAKKNATIKVHVHGFSLDINEVFQYKVRIVTKVPKRFEPNANSNKKNVIARKNTAYTGLLTEDDTDKWTFKAPKSGKYKVYGDISKADDFSEYYSFECKKGKNYIGYGNLGAGDGWSALTGKIKLKKGQKITVRMTAGYYYNCLYKLKVKKVK